MTDKSIGTPDDGLPFPIQLLIYIQSGWSGRRVKKQLFPPVPRLLFAFYFFRISPAPRGAVDLASGPCPFEWKWGPQEQLSRLVFLFLRLEECIILISGIADVNIHWIKVFPRGMHFSVFKGVFKTRRLQRPTQQTAYGVAFNVTPSYINPRCLQFPSWAACTSLYMIYTSEVSGSGWTIINIGEPLGFAQSPLFNSFCGHFEGMKNVHNININANISVWNTC